EGRLPEHRGIGRAHDAGDRRHPARLSSRQPAMNDMKRNMKDQVAIVTGGARGIGRGIAARLAAEGCRVVIWDRDPDAFEAPNARFEPVALVHVDVADLGSVEAAFAETLRHAGRADILINNAGVNGPVAPTWEYPVEAWHRVLAVDLTGVF